MSKLKSILIVCTFFCLWLSVFFADTIEDSLAFILILTIGIFHGTSDIGIIQNLSHTKKNIIHLQVALSYLFIIILATVLFTYLPAFALGLFIIVSAYHFGEQHWSSYFTNITIWSALHFTLYGMVILFSLFFLNYKEVFIIIKDITSYGLSSDFFGYIWVISSGLLVVLTLFLLKTKKLRMFNIILELFYLLIFLIVFKTASLLWAFAIYFIFWHSIPSIVDQVQFLYGGTKKEDFVKYAKSSLLYWVISIFGLGILYFIFKDQKEIFLSIFFISIAAITFPHVWVMSRLNK
ncbi:Brp/Blh family beta-carotene 15,15'-dioxygenase [Aquimarina brevivitae]|uniref:Brp/Blh family beta-carotene 15,15'-dioxygenase n=1 Tax=Aquimarina brevivitae TaxID=323412 RepID=UPI0013EE9F97|nr:Brp/Blh family beta-carotene 15,15'-dioxygenase [Aquimarina brevivitae]